MNKIKLIYLIIFSLLFSCTAKKTDTTLEDLLYINDPRLPGGGIGNNGSVSTVYNVQVDVSEYNKVKFFWNVPSLVQNANWQIVIFRVEADGLFQDIEIDDPSTQIGTSTFEQIRIKANTWTDETVNQNQSYYYWIFVNVDGDTTTGSPNGIWSKSAKFYIETPIQFSDIIFPELNKFWTKIKWSDFVYEPSQQEPKNNFQTLNAGLTTTSSPKGRIYQAYDGGVLFFSDTNNNRVLVFEDPYMRECEQYKDNEFDYFACRLQGSGNRASPFNILGQPDPQSTLSCQEHTNVCGNYSDFSINCEANTVQASCETSQYSPYCSWNSSNNTCVAKNVQSVCENSLNHKGFCKWDSGSNSCKVNGSKCLTKPTGLFVDGNSLVIADSGNDRVVLHDEILFAQQQSQTVKNLIGCDPEIFPTRIVPTRCSASKVFGKKSLDDFNVYDIATDGKSSLSNPNDVLVDSGSLYIADTNNNRIVKAYNYKGSQSYLCSESAWLQNLCSWQTLLGQPTFFSKQTFKDFYGNNTSLLTGALKNTLSDESFLRKYFRNPTKMKMYKYVSRNLKDALSLRSLWTNTIRQNIIDANGDLSGILEIPAELKSIYNNASNNIRKSFMIATNEDFLTQTDIGNIVSIKGRLLFYEVNPLDGVNPVCNIATFSTANCNASDVLGQENFSKVIVIDGTTGGAGSYSGVNYSFESIGGFDVVGDRLLVSDYLNNNIYVYENFPYKINTFWTETGRVLNPQGAYDQDVGTLPFLKTITDLIWDDFNGKLYIMDNMDYKIYQLDFEILNN